MCRIWSSFNEGNALPEQHLIVAPPPQKRSCWTSSNCRSDTGGKQSGRRPAYTSYTTIKHLPPWRREERRGEGVFPPLSSSWCQIQFVGGRGVGGHGRPYLAAHSGHHISGGPCQMLASSRPSRCYPMAPLPSYPPTLTSPLPKPTSSIPTPNCLLPHTYIHYYHTHTQCRSCEWSHGSSMAIWAFYTKWRLWMKGK